MRSHAKGSTRSGASKAKRLVLPAAVLALVLALAVPQASAVKFHAFKEVFGSAAQPTVNAWALGIDQSSGDVLVMDATGGDFTIKRFNSNGTPDNFSALGTNVIDGEGGPDTTPQNGLTFGLSVDSQIVVDNSGGGTDGNIYVTQSSPRAINVFASTGAYLGQLTAAGVTNFNRACGVAVDPSGALYVGDFNNGIHKFVPAANPPVNADHTTTFTSVTQPCTLGMGAGPTAGFLFPATRNGPISKIDIATGELKYIVASGSHSPVTVDPGTGHVFGMGSAIKEFDASGAGSATAVSNTDPEGALQGLAVRGSTGDIYYSVSISTSDKVQVLSAAISTAPDVTTNAATNITATTATLNGTVNPDGLGLSECKFEYGKTTSYGQSVPCAESLGLIGSGTSPVSVHADVSGLEANGAEYDFRLVATNPEASANGDNQSFTTLGPVITDTWAEDVGITEAVLKAEVNPKGSPTTYHFEYGTTPAYGNETAELNVGSDSSPHEVLLSLQDLEPGTTYHYRVVAASSDAVNEGPDREIRTFKPITTETDCPNQANRYGAGAALPDCRAYEMVSPLDKGNGDIRVLPGGEASYPARITKSTPSGERLTYSSYRAFGDALSAPFTSQYIAQRVAGEGWETHSINEPRGEPIFQGIFQFFESYRGFTDDLCHGWLVNYNEPPLAEGALAGYQNLYRRDDRLCGPEGFQTLAPTATPSVPPGRDFQPAFQGASADGSHSIVTLFEFGVMPEWRLYESVEPGAPLRFVCVLPDGTPWTGTCQAGSGGTGKRVASTLGAISADGERIFWSDNASGEGKLYVRIDGTETLPVSQGGEALAGTTDSFFWGAATDGSRAVYTTGGTSNTRLFAFDVDTEATEPIAEGVRGVMGMSEDARRIYFVSSKALDGAAAEGQPNLYFYDADQEGGATTFIATFAAQDIAEARSGPVGREPVRRYSRVTADGLHAAFISFAPLTGYDNKDLQSGAPQPQAFVYDANTEELICASCNPSGARDRQNLIVSGSENGPEGLRPIPGFDTSLHAPRALSEDGSRLFFNSISSLTPRDTNGKIDVYQWEAEGAAGCDSGDSSFAPSAGGCIGLISSGKSTVDSKLVEASATGDDVFISTLSSLVPQDYGLGDIYDARMGGGFPLPPETPECIGDACQSIPAVPNDPTPASAGFRGAGDPQPRKSQRRCRARNRQRAKGSKTRQKKAKRCRRNNRRAGR